MHNSQCTVNSQLMKIFYLKWLKFNAIIAFVKYNDSLAIFPKAVDVYKINKGVNAWQI